MEVRTRDGSSPEKQGIDAVRGKTDWWLGAREVSSCLFVAHDRFVVHYDLDVTAKQSGERMQFSEVGVYTLKDEKITREEFLPFVGEG